MFEKNKKTAKVQFNERKLFLYMAYDKVKEEPFDYFVAVNDSVAVRDGLSVFLRMRAKQDIAFYRIAEIDPSRGVILTSYDTPIECDIDSYKFPETISMPVSDYENLQRTLAEFHNRIQDLETPSVSAAEARRVDN